MAAACDRILHGFEAEFANLEVVVDVDRDPRVPQARQEVFMDPLVILMAIAQKDVERRARWPWSISGRWARQRTRPLHRLKLKRFHRLPPGLARWACR